jgi:Zn-finger nucleic acid-binding protein
MKRPSLRERILSYYRKNAGVWISGGHLEKVVTANTTYKASTASRRARELHEDGLLERKEIKGTVFYRYFPQTKTVEKVIVEGNMARVVHTTIRL